MKTQPVTRFFAVVCAGALASCANPTTPPPTRMQVSASSRPNPFVSASSQPGSSISERLYQDVNAYRRSRGAAELQRHAGLDRLAKDHCEYLRKHRGTFTLNGKNVSHIGFEGRTLIAREHFQMYNISENVAAANHPGSPPTTAIVSLWKGSKDHHKNMLDDWTHTGVGIVVDSDGMAFATQLFSTISMSQMATRERFNRF